MTDNTQMETAGWRVSWLNQYTRPIGYGSGATLEEARANADKDASATLSRTNPNWKWRKAKLKIDARPPMGCEL